MHYVYILRSESNPDQTYVGSTDNLPRRIAEHNSGESAHTRRFMPWRMMIYIAFPEKMLGERFEEYLKSGSGRAFAKRHLWDSDERHVLTHAEYSERGWKK